MNKTKQTPNQRIVANYWAALSMAAERRKRIQERYPVSFTYYIQERRNDMLKEARELLSDAKTLRINAVQYLTEVA